MYFGKFYLQRATLCLLLDRPLRRTAVTDLLLFIFSLSSLAAKRLITFVEKLKFKVKPTKKHLAELRRYRQWVIRQVVDNLELYRHGFIVKVQGVVRWLIPYIHSILTDWPEGQQTANFFEGAVTSRENCRACRRHVSDFANTSPPLVEDMRDQDATEWARAVGRGEAPDQHGNVLQTVTAREAFMQERSIHPESCALAYAFLFNGAAGYTGVLPMDQMHVIAAGIARLIRNVVKESAVSATLDTRLQAIPIVRDQAVRGFYYRYFRQGIGNIQQFTCDMEMALLQQLPYAIGNLHARCGGAAPGMLVPVTTTFLIELLVLPVGRSDAVIRDERLRRAIVRAAVITRMIWRVMKLRKPHEADVQELEGEATLVGPEMLVGVVSLSPCSAHAEHHAYT